MDKLTQTNDNSEIINFLIAESEYLDKLIKIFGNVSNNLHTFLTNLHNLLKNCNTHNKILEIEHHLGAFKVLLIELNECIASKVNKPIPNENDAKSPENETLIQSNDKSEIMDLARYTNYHSQDSINDFLNKKNINNFNLLNISMGSLLASMLWVYSKQENFVDILLTNENYLKKFIILCDSTVENFLLLYAKKLPPINSINFKYVISICGILTNISAQFQGRQYIMSFKEGLIYIKHVFEYINKLYTDGGEPMRRIFLMFLCNIARNKKGLAFMHYLDNCIISIIPGLYVGNSNNVKLLTLHYLIDMLTDCPMDIYYILKESIADNLLEELKLSGNEQITEATEILYSLLINNANNSFVTK